MDGIMRVCLPDSDMFRDFTTFLLPFVHVAAPSLQSEPLHLGRLMRPDPGTQAGQKRFFFFLVFCLSYALLLERKPRCCIAIT